MKEEIIKKLNLKLSKNTPEESDILYILTEIRKFLEREKLKNNFPILNFYCNWVLHAEIEKTYAIQSILEKIEKDILSKEYDPSNIMVMVSFEKLFKEMTQFLNKFKISNTFADINYLKDFREKLVGILINIPLKPKQRKIEEFKFVKSNTEGFIDYVITFKNSIHIPINGGFYFINS
ncbi:MAG: hypothetical protein AAB334_01570 [Patescibacteria group bacterium]